MSVISTEAMHVNTKPHSTLYSSLEKGNTQGTTALSGWWSRRRYNNSL